jgi:translation initiation factor IF-3
MCDILKPPEQVHTAQSSSSDLVSAGAEATASVAAIMDAHPYAEPSGTASSDGA